MSTGIVEKVYKMPLEYRIKARIRHRRFDAKETPEAREVRLAKSRAKFVFWRDKVIEALGARCKTCGFEDRRALQIDHVNGGGQSDRRERGYGNGYSYGFCKKILADPDFLLKYQILCANCNWIKRHENKEYNRGVGRKKLVP